MNASLKISFLLALSPLMLSHTTLRADNIDRLFDELFADEPDFVISESESNPPPLTTILQEEPLEEALKEENNSVVAEVQPIESQETSLVVQEKQELQKVPEEQPLVEASSTFSEESEQLITQNSQEVPPSKMQPDNTDTTPSATSNDHPVLIANGKALVLLGTPQLVDVEANPPSGTVNFVNLQVPGGPEALRSQLEPLFLNQPLTENEILAIKRAILRYYRLHDQPLVAVQVPEQDVTNGILQLIVMPAKLGQVTVVGNKWTKPNWLKKEISIEPGAPIRQSTIARDLNWVNRNPFRKVDLIYSPGKAEGTTDLELLVQERRPYRFYTGAENTGLKRIGEQRLYAGFNWGNAFGLDHILSYQFTTGVDPRKFHAHTVNYTAPLSWHHVLVVYGGYSDVHVELPNHFRNKGHSAQGSLRYEIPLKTRKSFLQDFIWGFDFKRTNNTLEFTEGETFFGGNVNLTQAMLGYNAGYQSKHNKTSLEAEIFYSPGEWISDQSHHDYQRLSPFSQCRYVYGRLALKNILQLPKEFTFETVLRGQLSDQNLLPSEQLGIGGYDTVRGYKERELNVDDGIILNAEVRTPKIRLMKHWRRKVDDGLQFLAFLDYGIGGHHHRLEGEPKTQYLLGIGPGLRYVIDPNLYIRLDLGFKLHRHDFGGDITRLHFGVIASY